MKCECLGLIKLIRLMLIYYRYAKTLAQSMRHRLALLISVTRVHRHFPSVKICANDYAIFTIFNNTKRWRNLTNSWYWAFDVKNVLYICDNHGKTKCLVTTRCCWKKHHFQRLQAAHKVDIWGKLKKTSVPYLVWLDSCCMAPSRRMALRLA